MLFLSSEQLFLLYSFLPNVDAIKTARPWGGDCSNCLIGIVRAGINWPSSRYKTVLVKKVNISWSGEVLTTLIDYSFDHSVLTSLSMNRTLKGDKMSVLAHTHPRKQVKKDWSDHLQAPGLLPNLLVAWCPIWWFAKVENSVVVYGLNIFIDIQTSKTLIQMDINKMMRMEFIQWRVNTYS